VEEVVAWTPPESATGIDRIVFTQRADSDMETWPSVDHDQTSLPAALTSSISPWSTVASAGPPNAVRSTPVFGA